MEQQPPKDTGLLIHRVQNHFITLLMGFCTYMVADVWINFKSVVEDYRETKSEVQRHDILIQTQDKTVDILTGRVDYLSDRINRYEYPNSHKSE